MNSNLIYSKTDKKWILEGCTFQRSEQQLLVKYRNSSRNN